MIVFDKKGVDDPHDNASLSIDKQGNLWIFISGRNTRDKGIIDKWGDTIYRINFTITTPKVNDRINFRIALKQ